VVGASQDVKKGARVELRFMDGQAWHWTRSWFAVIIAGTKRDEGNAHDLVYLEKSSHIWTLGTLTQKATTQTPSPLFYHCRFGIGLLPAGSQPQLFVLTKIEALNVQPTLLGFGISL
jgi:hypothetical protein